MPRVHGNGYPRTSIAITALRSLSRSAQADRTRLADRTHGAPRLRRARSCGHSARLAAGSWRSWSNGQLSISACVAGSLGLQPDARSKAICRRSGSRTTGCRALPPGSGGAAGAVSGALTGVWRRGGAWRSCRETGAGAARGCARARRCPRLLHRWRGSRLGFGHAQLQRGVQLGVPAGRRDRRCSPWPAARPAGPVTTARAGPGSRGLLRRRCTAHITGPDRAYRMPTANSTRGRSMTAMAMATGTRASTRNGTRSERVPLAPPP